jgi:cobalt-zinc-cadmium efflux system protein
MSMHGRHDQDGDAHHATQADRRDRAFAIGVGLNLALVLLQIGGGIVANSLALIADAGHNASDVLALLLAWGASVLVRQAPSGRRTYGFRKSSILASLINAVVLLIAVGAIAWEAVQRLFSPQSVAPVTVAWIAAIAIAVNTATALMFLRGRQHDLNVRGAFLHMASDAAVSGGVVVAALGIALTGWQWLDPVASLGIGTVITMGTWSLLRESLDLAMDAVPEGIDQAAVSACLAGLPGVVEVHDLHIWAMSTTETALTAHLVCPEGGMNDQLLAAAREELRARFRIDHATIQLEGGDPRYPCVLAPGNVV